MVRPLNDFHEAKVRIKLSSYSASLLNLSCNNVLQSIKESNTSVKGPVFLPTRRRVYCVLRSPHVNKDSREHFEIRSHFRIIDISSCSSETIEMLMRLDLPTGVNIEIKT
uniref:Small ribosomal subunit protein uS10c n=1 Tax=Cyanidium caldarium TaxID=2771 RepID=RR10_CYACA|nr:ribosomal protein S10 [Cyanidium caldarium]Q9TLV9.1 RecName: Full=Small ribosomal subunit protein uS10c; AltName: Full=30S ribosomal protein S10, chloroplastic [Cyanidium caldarium]AAF12935.1 unknown [Cyanidium caldarium]WDB00284.1 ribosomal protein S10 [Cyanidium caldarium]